MRSPNIIFLGHEFPSSQTTHLMQACHREHTACYCGHCGQAVHVLRADKYTQMNYGTHVKRRLLEGKPRSAYGGEDCACEICLRPIAEGGGATRGTALTRAEPSTDQDSPGCQTLSIRLARANCIYFVGLIEAGARKAVPSIPFKQSSMDP